MDDETGEPLVQRDDDKPESVRKRLDAYDNVSFFVQLFGHGQIQPWLFVHYKYFIMAGAATKIFRLTTLIFGFLLAGDGSAGRLLREKGSTQDLSRNPKRCHLS